MKVIGLIMEGNPLHNGHKYLINKAKTLFPEALFIVVTSTSFTMRGEASIINKFDKTKYYLDLGVDLVMELPISQTLQSADYFSKNTINILNSLNIDTLIVGSENIEMNVFDNFYQIETSETFLKQFKLNLLEKLSYKVTYEKTLSDLAVDHDQITLFNQPNMTLAYQYYKVLKHTNIEFYPIKRTTSYYNTINDTNEITSATNIRNLFLMKLPYQHFLPFEEHFNDLSMIDKNLMLLINYEISKKDNTFVSINGNTEGIDNYILKNGDFNHNFTDLVKSLSNKRYSASRIRRLLLSMILKIDNINNNQYCYLRILGFSKRGSQYLNTLSNDIKKQLFSSIQEINNLELEECVKKMALQELFTTKVYGILTSNLMLYLEEYKLPIRKKE